MLFDDRRALPWLLAPALVLMAGLTIYPIADVLWQSLVRVDFAAGEYEWLGGANYSALLGDWFFRTSVRNTLVFSVTASLVQVALGLALALLFEREFPGRRLALPALIYPMMLSTLVCSAIWRAWYHYDFGLLNNALLALGLSPVRWLFDPDLALFAIVLVDTWQWTPMTFLIVLAGLQSIPRDIREAAVCDGAGAWRRFAFITLPLLRRALMLALLLRSVDTFKLFDKVYALTGGGPGNATETLSMFVYRQGFKYFNLGLASAAAVIMLAVAVALSGAYAAQLAGGRR